MEPNHIQVFRLQVVEGAPEVGVKLISLVDHPAHEIDFVAFSQDQTEPVAFAGDRSKRNITGPIMVPNKLIPRHSAKNGKHLVFATAEDIEGILKNYVLHGRHNNINIGHNTPLVAGTVMLESWIVGKDGIDKSKSLGFDLPEGTWMGTFHVTDDALWNDIQSGKGPKGYSIEGALAYLPVHMEEDVTSDTIEDNEEEGFRKALLDLIADDSSTDTHLLDQIKILFTQGKN
jgi:hypothetical protein